MTPLYKKKKGKALSAQHALGAKKKPKPASPLGRWIAGFLSPKHDNRVLALELFGEERASAWIKWLSRARVRKKGSLEAELHDWNDQHVGRFFAWLCMVLENVDGKYRKACTRGLYQGRTKRWDPELQKVVHVPGKEAGGVAARLGVSPREVQNFARLAAKMRVISRAQVKDHARVMELPKHMRGKRWSYSIVHWLGEIPRAVRSHLESWWANPNRRRFTPPKEGAQAVAGDPVPTPEELAPVETASESIASKAPGSPQEAPDFPDLGAYYLDELRRRRGTPPAAPA